MVLTIRDIVFKIGGGMRQGDTLKAVQIRPSEDASWELRMSP